MTHHIDLEDLNLKFLVEDLPESREEVDSVSKQVISFECGSESLPKYFVNSDIHAVQKEKPRLRTVS